MTHTLTSPHACLTNTCIWLNTCVRVCACEPASVTGKCFFPPTLRYSCRCVRVCVCFHLLLLHFGMPNNSKATAKLHWAKVRWTVQKTFRKNHPIAWNKKKKNNHTPVSVSTCVQKQQQAHREIKTMRASESWAVATAANGEEAQRRRLPAWLSHSRSTLVRHFRKPEKI